MQHFMLKLTLYHYICKLYSICLCNFSLLSSSLSIFQVKFLVISSIQVLPKKAQVLPRIIGGHDLVPYDKDAAKFMGQNWDDDAEVSR